MGIIWGEGNRFELNGIRFQFIGQLRELFALKEEDGLVLEDSALPAVVHPDVRRLGLLVLNLPRSGGCLRISTYCSPCSSIASSVTER